MTEIKKPWYTSKTKIGAALAGLGPVLITLGGMIEGNTTLIQILPQLLMEVGAVLAIFGIRDWPILNKIK